MPSKLRGGPHQETVKINGRHKTQAFVDRTSRKYQNWRAERFLPCPATYATLPGEATIGRGNSRRRCKS